MPTAEQAVENAIVEQLGRNVRVDLAELAYQLRARHGLDVDLGALAGQVAQLEARGVVETVTAVRLAR